jgi:hypothetical protein
MSDTMVVVRAPWKLDSGEIIDLITPRELATLPNGTVLFSILNERVVKGKDEIDDDTRRGMLAYGLPSDRHFDNLLTYTIEIPAHSPTSPTDRPGDHPP